MATWMNSHLLSFLVFAPLVLGLALAVLPQRFAALAKHLGFLGSLGLLVLAALLLLRLVPDTNGILLTERVAWFTLGGIPVDYHLAADGLNLWLVLLTCLLTPLTLAGTWNSVQDRPGRFTALFLMLETCALGAFLAQDLLLFYLFWEALLIPMYFLIGVWGGEHREYAARKFVLYTLAGSLLWLVALLYLAGKAGSFAPALMGAVVAGLPFKAQALLFGAFTLAFAIKVPLFPLHTWLPDAHTEAPTAGSVILAGVLLKLGSYAFLRFALPVFPQAALHYARPLAILAVIAIIFGALVAMVQWDIKRLVAYSSVSHMGFVMLGLTAMTPLGIQGSILQMLNHGISTGALFLLVGMLYDRAHTRQIADFGGVARRMPVFTFFFMLVTLSSLGLPPTNGFAGEFMILLGTFTSGFAWGRVLAALAVLGVLGSAVYLLWMVKRVFWGPENPDPQSGTAHLHEDLNAREIAVLLPFVALILWMGLRPGTFLAHSEGPVAQLLEQARAPRPRAPMAQPPAAGDHPTGAQAPAPAQEVHP